MQLTIEKLTYHLHCKLLVILVYLLQCGTFRTKTKSNWKRATYVKTKATPVLVTACLRKDNLPPTFWGKEMGGLVRCGWHLWGDIAPVPLPLS